MLIAGGAFENSLEILTNFNKANKEFPDLHEGIFGACLILHNGTLLLFGGFRNDTKCLQLDNGSWKEHSLLNQIRRDVSASGVSTKTETYVFGGLKCPNTYEYLPKNSTTWILGKTKIPGGFKSGCAIFNKSKQEILLIGGAETGDRILSFDVTKHTFEELPVKLNVKRKSHASAFIPGTNKIIITGGQDGHAAAGNPCNLTEILDIESKSVTMASPMNVPRAEHGIGLITINEQDKLIVFSGWPKYNASFLESVEMFNEETQKWDMTDIQMDVARSGFGYVNVSLSDIEKL